MKVPFLSFAAVNEPHFDRIEQAMSRVLRSGYYVLGPEVAAFEREFAGYVGTRYCVGVASGLDALTLTLKAWIILGRLTPGDEVAVPANTYIASILAITAAGLKPLLVEPCSKTFNLDPGLLEAALTPKTRAVLPVHLYGQCAEMDKINAIAKSRDLLVMTDVAQAAGASRMGRKAGSLADAAAHSFYPGKNLGSIGEGGAITTDDEELAQCIAKLRNYGSAKKYHNELPGQNARLHELQAAVLRIKLEALDQEVNQRRRLASHYNSSLNRQVLELPVALSRGEPSWHLYVVRTSSRESFMSFLEQNGVGSAIHYPVSPHRQPAYAQWNHRSYPITERIHETVVSLPLNPAMSMEHADRVAEVVDAFASRYL